MRIHHGAMCDASHDVRRTERRPFSARRSPFFLSFRCIQGNPRVKMGTSQHQVSGVYDESQDP